MRLVPGVGVGVRPGELRDLGVPLAQGFVFAAPRPVRPEIFGELPQPFSLDEEPMRLRRAG